MLDQLGADDSVRVDEQLGGNGENFVQFRDRAVRVEQDGMREAHLFGVSLDDPRGFVAVHQQDDQLGVVLVDFLQQGRFDAAIWTPGGAKAEHHGLTLELAQAHGFAIEGGQFEIGRGLMVPNRKNSIGRHLSTSN